MCTNLTGCCLRFLQKNNGLKEFETLFKVSKRAHQHLNKHKRNPKSLKLEQQSWEIRPHHHQGYWLCIAVILKMLLNGVFTCLALILSEQKHSISNVSSISHMSMCGKNHQCNSINYCINNHTWVSLGRTWNSCSTRHLNVNSWCKDDDMLGNSLDLCFQTWESNLFFLRPMYFGLNCCLVFKKHNVLHHLTKI